MAGKDIMDKPVSEISREMISFGSCWKKKEIFLFKIVPGKQGKTYSPRKPWIYRMKRLQAK